MPATPLPSFRPRAPNKRPVYLVVALLLVWVVGLFGATEGCQTIDVLHRPEAVRKENSRLTESHPNDGEMVRRREALIDTVLAFRKTVTPLAIGQLLLGSVLTLSAGLTLLGRGQARRIAVQAIVIYALFLPIDYFARKPMRASAIDAIAEGAPLPGFDTGSGSPDVADQRVFFWWVYRGALGLQLVILTMGLFAMTRPRVRAFWSAMGSEPSGGDEP